MHKIFIFNKLFIINHLAFSMLKYANMKDEKFMSEEEKMNKKINHLLDNLVIRYNIYIFINLYIYEIN